MIIKPQPGFQEKALSTSADIAILGGAAGCGKTWVELLEPIRHVSNSGFRTVIFRKSMPQIKAPGGLWDASKKLYPLLNAIARVSEHEWIFPSGAIVSMKQLESEMTLIEWQGAEIALIEFDELTHFTKKMFIYMLSRNRSTCGVKPYVRATCNPDPDSWVAGFIEWWIDQDTGFPIIERIGKLRYMATVEDNIVWGNTKQEVLDLAPSLMEHESVKKSGVNPLDLIKSVTFIPGLLHENPELLRINPAYLGNLLALGEDEQLSLLQGNWKVRLDGTELFNHKGISNIFTNYPEQSPRPRKCITVDAARFGRDFCVIYVWKGWEVIHISVFKKSDVHDIVNEIERLRGKFNIMRTDVVVDSDGIGGDSVKLGQYTGFSGGAHAMRDPITGKQENYHNLKTQCYYRVSYRANDGGIRINVSNETCLIFDDSTLKGKNSTTIKVGSVTKDIRDLIKEDLKAIKRAGLDEERKYKINEKAEQKIILNGRSPDFGDTLMMREFLELNSQDIQFKRTG